MKKPESILMNVGDRLYLYGIGMFVGIMIGIQIGRFLFKCKF